MVRNVFKGRRVRLLLPPFNRFRLDSSKDRLNLEFSHDEPEVINGIFKYARLEPSSILLINSRQERLVIGHVLPMTPSLYNIAQYNKKIAQGKFPMRPILSH
jgi:hypothetical protein